VWSSEELVERWSLGSEELALLPGKADAGKLAFALQLAFYKQYARFPEDGRAAPVAFLEDFVEVTTGTGVERFEAPIVENEELDAGEAAQDAGIAAIAAGECEFGEELGNPLIENRAVVAAGFVTQGTSKAMICPRRSARTRSDCRACRSTRHR
jgi:hypothetical protein